MRAPASLTWRLVITVVLLVAVTCVLIGTATTLAMRGYLTERLDRAVAASLGRASSPDRGDLGDRDGPGGRDGPPGGGPGPDVLGQGIGTVTAWISGDDAAGDVLVSSERGPGDRRTLDAEQLAVLAKVDAGEPVREVTLPGLGGYRVAATEVDGVTLVSGLPTEDVDDTVASLLMWQLALTAGGVAVAALAGVWVVRRQLAPLREVAAAAHEVSTMSLAEGDIELGVRLPDRLADERNEVGQVGAALNGMLAHVESALDARHRSEQQVRQFVADASHELRTPLATLRGYAELARRHPDDAETQRTAIDRVEAESARMSRLVEDLLLLARLDAGRPLVHEEIDLTHLLLEAVADARLLGAEHRWRLDLPDEPVVVLGDPDRLRQVVVNLLTNARVHTPPGTTVSVVVGVAPDPLRPVRLRVYDDGPGLPPGLADRAFERFARGDGARNRAGGGTGLGLALVHAITAALGGRATLEPGPDGVGTAVIVDLPTHS